MNTPLVLRPAAALLLLTLFLAACAAPQAAAPPQAVLPTPPPLANNALSQVTRVSEPKRYSSPFDATSNPDGTQLYFTAESDAGGGVFRVAGGETTPLAEGAPFVEPRGIAISADGATIYVADQAAPNSSGAGQVFALAANGGVPTALSGAGGYRPVALTVVREAGQDVLYITGSDPSDRRPALVRLPASGGAATVVAAGAPMVEPSGVTATRDGTLYVADRSAAGDGVGSVFRVRGSSVESIASGFLTGGPVVGVALTFDEKTLLVSSLEAQSSSAQALIVDLASLTLARFNNVIGANVGAGGLQRAANRDFFVWADSSPPRSGRPLPPGAGGIYALAP